MTLEQSLKLWSEFLKLGQIGTGKNIKTRVRNEFVREARSR